MTNRERFKAWAIMLPFRVHFDSFTGTDGVTCYAQTETQIAWEAWQAAEAVTARRCAEIAREMRYDLKPGNRAEDAIRAEYQEAFK